ncbi:MAG: preprotein translocase subunit SecG [Gammaproteobacteria bacterium RIFCSPHIGHO2_12_FULL_41_15]|nr:MAG: preprotein translocase subunit SecG [Gammaproteobacteria bacterium RIFCSPHIGHO2_12_FULL_41_15]
MYQFLLIIHLLVCIALLGLVLVQQGKGSDLGAAMGAGASNTMFGSQGATPFLMKVTYGFATAFFLTSLSLAYVVAHRDHSGDEGGFELSKGVVTQAVENPASTTVVNSTNHPGAVKSNAPQPVGPATP